jgi:hypothetical protein
LTISTIIVEIAGSRTESAMLKLKALLMCLFASRKLAWIDNSRQELILPPLELTRGARKSRRSIVSGG